MIESEGYCRELEAYLCRKNEGHLIRIAGPAFEQVTGWARAGIPLTVACAGIDRYFERYYRKGPRRRPVRIEFCEADVLDAFDDWRRAVGIARPGAGPTADASGDDEEQAERRRGSLASHIERAMARLTALRSSSSVARDVQDVLERTTRELDVLQTSAKRARGEAREAVLIQLGELDQGLMSAIRGRADASSLSAAEAEAKLSLTPFRDRMTPQAYERAFSAAVDRHLRQHFGLPDIAF